MDCRKISIGLCAISPVQPFNSFDDLGRIIAYVCLLRYGARSGLANLKKRSHPIYHERFPCYVWMCRVSLRWLQTSVKWERLLRRYEAIELVEVDTRSHVKIGQCHSLHCSWIFAERHRGLIESRLRGLRGLRQATVASRPGYRSDRRQTIWSQEGGA